MSRKRKNQYGEEEQKAILLEYELGDLTQQELAKNQRKKPAFNAETMDKVGSE